MKLTHELRKQLEWALDNILPWDDFWKDVPDELMYQVAMYEPVKEATINQPKQPTPVAKRPSGNKSLDINVLVVTMTERAVYVKYEEMCCWLPKSQLSFFPEARSNTFCRMCMPTWLAKKSELLPEDEIERLTNR